MRAPILRCSFALALAAAACASTDGLLGGRPDAGGGGSSDASAGGADARSDASSSGDATLLQDGGTIVDAGGDAYVRPTTPPPGCNGTAAGLVGYWRLDETGGTAVADCSGNGLNGTLTKGVWNKGVYGGALELAGDGLVDLQNPGKLQLTGALTVAAWIKIADFGGNGRILAKGGGGTDRGWELNVEGNGVGRLGIAKSDTEQVDVETPLQKNVWLHLAGTYEPNVALKIYLDGKLQLPVNTNAPPSIRASNAGARIGDRADVCCGFKGAIDELRVYDRALLADEIAALAR